MLKSLREKLNKRNKKSFKVYFKKYRLYFVISMVIIFLSSLFLLLKPIMVSSWLKYPLELKAEIAFDYFTNSFKAPCRSSCLTQRQEMRSILEKAWRNDKNYWDDKVISYLKASNNLNEKKALIDLSLNVYDTSNIPLALKAIISSENYSYEISNYIIRSYDQSFVSDNDLYFNLISQVISEDLSLKQRQSALLATYPFSRRENLLFCLSILNSSESLTLKETALELINSWSRDKVLMKEVDIEILASIALEKKLSSKLRSKIIWLISDYYNLYRERVIFSLTEIYEHENLDNISRAFAGKAINKLNASNLEIPFVSSKDWDEYYNNY